MSSKPVKKKYVTYWSSKQHMVKLVHYLKNAIRDNKSDIYILRMYLTENNNREVFPLHITMSISAEKG